MDNFWIDIYNTNKGYTAIDDKEGRDKRYWEQAVKAYNPKDILEGWVNIDHERAYTAGNLLALELRNDGKIWGLIEPNDSLEWYMDNKLVKYRSIEFTDDLEGFNTPYITGVAFLTSRYIPASKGLSRPEDSLRKCSWKNKRYIYKSETNFRASDFKEEIKLENYIINNKNDNNVISANIGGNKSMESNDRKMIDDLNTRLAQIEKEKQENEVRLSLENEKLRKEIENVQVARKQDEVKSYVTSLIDNSRILPRTIDAGFGELCLSLIDDKQEITFRGSKTTKYELFRKVVDSLDNKETREVNTEPVLDFKKLAEQRKEKVEKNKKDRNRSHPDDEYDLIAKTIIKDALTRGEKISYTVALERAIDIIKTQKKEA